MGEAKELTASPEVHGFVERYDPWTGRAWLEVLGPASRRIPIDARYAAVREELRERYPDRPFSSEWEQGRFLPSPLGLPPYPVLALGWLVASGVCFAGAAAAGPLGAGLCAVAATWPLLRLLDGVAIHERGLRIGPPWATLVPWHDVQAVGLADGRVWVRTRGGGGSGTVPRALMPAVRARLRRLGGIAAHEGDGGLDQRYAGWRSAATGAPWGLLVGTAAAAWLTPWPWEVLCAGLVVVSGAALLGAAVEARATGWGTGGVLWLTLLYALVLLTLTSLGQALP